MKQATKTRLDRLEHAAEGGDPRVFVVVQDIQDAEPELPAGYRADVDQLMVVLGIDPDRLDEP